MASAAKWVTPWVWVPAHGSITGRISLASAGSAR